jgi:CIC family chloride channel protein
VGAGIASLLGRRLGLGPASVKALVPIGASAALAAAFNTPIAAVLFSLEEVMGDMHAPVLGSIVLSSATSWIVLHLVLGDEPLFHVPAYQLVHPIEFLFYVVLGLAGGLMSAAFVKLLLWQRKHFLAMPKSTQWLQPVAGGLLVGLLGWFVPGVLGVGYGYVGQALNGQMLIGTMALLVLLKVVATATCYASGNAGGIFGPSLFMGAMMGGAVGGVAHLLMPDYTGSVGAYALVGMGVAFAGIVRVPLTSVIMIFEMTRDYSIIVPLMIANLIGYFISSRLQEEPIYEALQHQDHIHLPSGVQARRSLLMVGNAYQPQAQVLSIAETVSQAAGSVDRDRGAWPVADADGIRGMVTAEQLDAAMEAKRGDEPIGALVSPPGPIETLTAETFPHVHADHPLDEAMRRLAETGWKVVPVVSRTNVRELKGTISLSDILAAYQAGRTLPDSAAGKAGRRAPARLLTEILVALVVVATVAGFLSYYYRTERTARAKRYYQAGSELAANNRYDEAIAQYRNALSISHSTEHRLALGMALVKAGNLDEAAIYLNEVLRGNPGNGPANLGLARIGVAKGLIEDALLHYQRAIYGLWPDHATEKRLETRLEMVDSLAKAGRTAQTQAELLAIAQAMPEDEAVRKRVGRMLIDHGLPQDAARLFRSIVDGNKQDVVAWDGLGESEFAAGAYVEAVRALQAALRIDPRDAAAAQRKETAEAILRLDPTLAGLSSAERFERSRTVLKDVINEVGVCKGSDGRYPPPIEDAVKTAELSLAHGARPSSLSDAAEANDVLAGQLWTSRVKDCKPAPMPNDPLAKVMAKLVH